MILLLLLFGIVALFFVLAYNGLIGKKNAVENAFGALDALLKKRNDLIPNLVTTVQQYMGYEKETLNKITELRARASSADVSADEKVNISNQVSPLIRNILVSAESYPDLKASASFVGLQNELSGLENEIAEARIGYNNRVTEFNNGIEMFPSSFVASLMGLQHKPVLEIPAEERKNISAKELFGK